MELLTSQEPIHDLLRAHQLTAWDGGEIANLLAMGGDMVMIIRPSGVISDIALGNMAIEHDDHKSWIGKNWAEIVAIDSRKKVEQLLDDARNKRPARWREINHFTQLRQNISLRFVAMAIGEKGEVLALGRDHRATASLQQRLLEAQQSLERDYAHMRDTESRYRTLFKVTTEAVLIVDGSTRKVVEANPVAQELLGNNKALAGRPFTQLFASQSHEDAISLLSVALASPQPHGSEVILLVNGQSYRASAALFRQDRATHFLVRLSHDDLPARHYEKSTLPLLQAIERLPDSFVVTNLNLEIQFLNGAFLDLARLPTQAQAKGQLLSQFLGRPGVDRNILFDNLTKFGAVHNFPTLVQNQFGDVEDVEVSAVTIPDGETPFYGFTIRRVARRTPVKDLEAAAPEVTLPRTPNDMSQLVGRTSLKEIVRETADVIERLCIEAALEMTGDNRAAAAEILGVSRQSLYSKMNRFGIGGDANEADDDDASA
jgi:transcriptional regulator PpsR